MNTLETMMAFIIPFLYFFGLAGTFIYLFRKKNNFQVLLPISLMSAVLIVFVATAAFHNISLGLWLTVAASAAFVPLFILDKNRLKTLKEQILTPGFVIFCLVYVFLYLINFNREFSTTTDEMMHWGPHVRMMWLSNDFYQTQIHSGVVIHGDYPPAVQLFELIWCKLAGSFREGFLYMAVQLLGLSMLLPAVKDLSWARPKTRTLGIVALIVVVFISSMLMFNMNGADFFTTILLDSVVAAVFVYGLYLAFTESDKLSWTTVIKMSIAVTFLCLVKQVAILFAGLIVIVYVGCLWVNHRGQIRSKLSDATKAAIRVRMYWKHIVLGFVLFVMPIACLGLWSIQTSGYKSPDWGVATFHIEMSDVMKIPGVLSGAAGNQSQQGFAKAFPGHILLDSVGSNLNVVGHITYAQWVLLFVGAMVFIWFVCRGRRVRGKVVVLTGAMVAGWFVYCFAIYNIFLFGGMNDIERNNITTSDRYLKTYLLAMVLIYACCCVGIVVDYIKQEKYVAIRVLLVVLIIFWGILLSPNAYKEIRPVSKTAPMVGSDLFFQNTPRQWLSRINEISHSSFDQPARILVSGCEGLKEKQITPSEIEWISCSLRRHNLQYHALPSRVILFSANNTRERLHTLLDNSDYFLVDYLDDKTIGLVGKEITNFSNLKPVQGDVFKIRQSNGQIRLEKI